MSADITDLITKVGSPGTMTTLQAPGKPIGASSLLLTSPANWPSDFAVYFSIQRIDIATGLVVPGSYTVWKGILSGSAIDNLQLKYGSDQAYSAGEGVQVFIYISTTWANSLIDGLLTTLRPNGTIKPSVVDFESLTAAVKQRMYAAGDIKIHGRAALDTGWLWCDGAAVSRTTYADLFAAIGTAFGAGDGTTTFNLPNLKGRVPVGLDASQTEFDTLGKSGGNKTHAHVLNDEGWAQLNVTSGGNNGNLRVVNAATPFQPNRAFDGGAFAVEGLTSTGTGLDGKTASESTLPPHQVVRYSIRT